MASSWTTYSPDSLPTGDVKPDASHPTKASSLTPPVWNSNATYPDPSDLARDLPIVSSELMEPAAKLACIQMPSVQGRAGAFASSAIAFTSTTRSPSGTTIKTSPIVVSTTPLRVKFRETGPPTLLSISLDKLPTHSATSTLQIEDGLSARPGVHTDVKAPMTTVRPPDATIATRGSAPSTEPFPINPEPQPTSLPPPTSLRPELPPMPSSSPYDVNSSAQHTSTPKHPHPISAATNVGPQPRHGSTNVNPILTTNISTTSSPTVGAPSYTPPSVTLNPNLDLEREKLEGRNPKKSATGGSSGTPSIVRSSYTDMKLEEVPRLDCILSFILTWLLLAGFVVLPGTFNTLEGIQSGSTKVEKVLHTIQHLPLLVIGYACCGVGGAGMFILWIRWRHNYVWLLNSIFIPGLLNGVSGLLSTFAGIYGAQNGKYNTASIITLGVTGGCTIICGFLTTIYSLWKLNIVKRRHMREEEKMKNGDGEICEERHYVT